MSEQDRLVAYLAESDAAHRALDPLAIEAAMAAIDRARSAGATIFTIGNGGSAATAGHFAADLQKSTIQPGRRRVRTMPLADPLALLTAWSNDRSYEAALAEQIVSLAEPGDVLVAISASGNSPNVVAAVEAARQAGMTVIGLSGFSGGRLRELSDIAVHVPVDSYEIAEDVHHAVCHLLVLSQKPESARPNVGTVAPGVSV